LPEIVQEIGAYAGLASVLGLAVLSALYFSQARDVKRLREWAGRAPERIPGQAPQPGQQRVVAQPQRAGQPQATHARPGAPPVPGQQQRPGAPAVPGQQRPSVPAAAQAAATGARPAASTPAAQTAGAGAAAAKAANAHAPAKPGQNGDEGAAAAGQETTAPDGDGVNAQEANAQGGGATASSAPTQVVPGKAATPAGSRPGAPVVPAGRTPTTGTRLPNRPAPPRTVQTPEPEPAPWYRTPRYVVLALVGVLVVGGGAAAAVTQLGGSDESGGSGEQPAQQASGGDEDDGGTQRQQPPVKPASVTVAVLNGTTVPGLAAQVSDELQQRGFRVGNVDNSPDSSQQRAESVIQFASGHRREAVAVGRRLGIGQREPIDPAVQQLAGDATVVVIAGQDQDSTP
jgi:LytR cell envelope-related transcriptional attenuator